MTTPTHSFASTAHASIRLERLEPRRLMAVSFADGVITVAGSDAGGDVIVVWQADDSVLVSDNGVEHAFPSAGVTSVVATGGAGDDLIEVMNPDFFAAPVSFGGGSGNDSLGGGSGDDLLDAGDGNDIVFANRGNDQLRGGAGDELMDGGEGNDLLLGGRGNDLLGGSYGDDRIDGGAGNDLLWGEDGNDHLLGGRGNDTLEGGAGNDRLSGGCGTDRVDGGTDADVFLKGDTMAERVVDNMDVVTGPTKTKGGKKA